MKAGIAGEPAGCAGSRPPAVPWQPFHGLAEARWVLADFGGLFRLGWGSIFNPKEEEKVRYTMKKMKEI